MASVKIILREDKINKKTGLAPLYIRIIKDRKTKFVSLGIKVESKYWNSEKMSLRKGATNYIEINNHIIQKRAEIEKVSMELEAGSNIVTSSFIKSKVKGNKTYIFDYTDKKLKELEHKISYSTVKIYEHKMSKFERFCGTRKVRFSDIDIAFLKKYEKYMYEERGNSQSTVSQTFRILKAIFNNAINDEVISSNVYPFKTFKIPPIKSTRTYLNEQQFEAVLNYDTTKLGKNTLYYDMFIFSCYAGGLRFSDVINLKWQDYNEKEQRIVIMVEKTKRKHQFKLPNKALEIIEKYKTEESNTTDFIFPLLYNDMNYKLVPDTFMYHKTSHNHKTNSVLRKIGKELEFPFKLTFHTSRHTFATRALNKGMRIEHVSKILDHSSISITQIYAKIVNKELDKAMDIMND